jgi:5-methylcytosine-specific restriction endonuclease McrA
MLTCKICLRSYKQLRYPSARVCVCGHCVNDLNEYHEVAEHAQEELGELLKRGMLRNAHADTSPSAPRWRQEKAQHVLANFEAEFARALPNWLNGLLAKAENRSKPYKMLRAYRRGLLHFDRPRSWGYPPNWQQVAAKMRRLDGFGCVACNARDTELHVHHIVYASNFGTHRQENLVTLCRPCHETEHERVLDFGESEELEGAKATT